MHKLFKYDVAVTKLSCHCFYCYLYRYYL